MVSVPFSCVMHWVVRLEDMSKRLNLMTSLHLLLLLLESYAVLNRVGFRKILKKHDKLTGFNTAEKYMKKVVGQEMFSNHYWIRVTLFSIEEEFTRIKNDLKATNKVDHTKSTGKLNWL